jgi:hypothetical protein
MAVLKMKLDGEKYMVDTDKLTLGEAEILEEEFGLEDLSELNIFRAKHLRGLFFTAVKRKHPELSDDDVLAKVRDGVTGDVFEDLNRQVQEAIKKAEAEKADPPKAGVNASAPAANKPPRTPGRGSRSTPKS